RLAFVAGASGGTGLSHARFQDDIGSRGLTGWLASFTNRASGLAAMTDAVRQSLVLGTQGFMAEARAARMAWADLPDAMKDALRRWDMGEEEFRQIVNSKPFAHDEGADFIRPEDVAAAGHPDTASKYEMWLVSMAQEASNEPALLTRAIAT